MLLKETPQLTQGVQPRGGCTYNIRGVPETFILTLNTILTWEEKHGGMYDWITRIKDDGYRPKLAEVRDILAGAYLKDSQVKEKIEETRLILSNLPENYFVLAPMAFEIVEKAFHPSMDLEEDEEELKKTSASDALNQTDQSTVTSPDSSSDS